MLHFVNRTLSVVGAFVTAVLLTSILFTNPSSGQIAGRTMSAFSIADALLGSGAGGFAARLEAPPRDSVAALDGPSRVSFGFQFEGRRVAFKVPVTEYDRTFDTDISKLWSGPVFEQRRKVRSFGKTYSELPIIDKLAGKLREVRKERRLDSDQYAEMIVTIAQRLPYNSPPGTEMRSPVGVLLDGKGDCDERALLAASILLHEGYGVALFKFDQEQHAALGLKSNAERFRTTPYAFVEMTKESYIGDDGADAPAVTANKQGPWSDPVVCDIGGTRSYHSGDEVAYILRRRDAAAHTMQALSPAVGSPEGREAAINFNLSGLVGAASEYTRACQAFAQAEYGMRDRTGTYRWLRAHSD